MKSLDARLTAKCAGDRGGGWGRELLLSPCAAFAPELATDPGKQAEGSGENM